MSEKRELVVVTGAAGGIGRGIAGEALARGKAVVLLDVDPEPLAEAAASLSGANHVIHTRVVDVGNASAMQDAATEIFDEHGRIDYLFNNAGVFVGGLSWDRSADDWAWTFEVNVMGVVNGIRAFVPHMITSGQRGYVVNTSSTAGLSASPLFGAYCASKFAIVGLTETLQMEFELLGLPLKAALICPGRVHSGIGNSQRTRPVKFAGLGPAPSEAVRAAYAKLTSQGRGITPEELGALVFASLDKGDFYIISHPEELDRVRLRCEQLLSFEHRTN